MEGGASLPFLGNLEGKKCIVLEDMSFSSTRLKITFIGFVSWAGVMDLGDCSLVRILLCIL